jgi:hypothetical protein
VAGPHLGQAATEVVVAVTAACRRERHPDRQGVALSAKAAKIHGAK